MHLLEDDLNVTVRIAVDDGYSAFRPDNRALGVRILLNQRVNLF